MKNKNIAYLLLGGIAIYYLMRNQQPRQAFIPNQTYVPPPPPQGQSNGQAWSQWVGTIVNSFGTVASLWAPGGPFHNQPITPEQAQQIAYNAGFGFNQFP